jgi:putative methyltransferase (TIGR04325 family)
MSEARHTLLEASITLWMSDLAGIRWLRRLRYDRRVRSGTGWSFWGVFGSYEEALNAVPSRSPLGVGYDTPGIAERGRAHYERMHGFDYPALLWMSRLLDSPASRNGDAPPTVVDLGGHLGVKYRAFLQCWDPPAGLSWIVCETPATVAAAAELPAEDMRPGLSFTTDPRVMDGAQLLFASGVLSYLESSLADLLDACRRPPEHLILNKVALAPGPEVWTLQNASGVTIVPYHVFNRSRFLEQLTARGYRLLDEWAVPEIAVRIPFHPAFGTTANRGLALTRAAG